MPNSLREPDLTPLHAWLIEAGTNDVAAETLFDGFCGRLVAAGVPIARGFLSIAGLHPLRRAYSLTWHDGRIVEATDFGHATMATPLQRTTCSRPISATMRPTASVPGKCSAAPSAGSLLPFSVLTCAALPTSLRRRRPRR